MRKPVSYLLIGSFTFLLGIIFVYFFVIRPSIEFEKTKEVCQKCLDLLKTDSTIESKTLSEMINSLDLKDKFIGKKVYLKAIFVNDKGNLFLHEINDGKTIVGARFDKNSISCGNTERSLQICTDFLTKANDSYYSSEINVVGYLDDEKTVNGVDIFNIICIEQVNATEEDFNKGIRRKFWQNPLSIFKYLKFEI